MHNALHQISVKIGAGSKDGGMKNESRLPISELEEMLERDKSELKVLDWMLLKIRHQIVA